MVNLRSALLGRAQRLDRRGTKEIVVLICRYGTTLVGSPADALVIRGTNRGRFGIQRSRAMPIRLNDTTGAPECVRRAVVEAELSVLAHYAHVTVALVVNIYLVRTICVRTLRDTTVRIVVVPAIAMMIFVQNSR